MLWIVELVPITPNLVVEDLIAESTPEEITSKIGKLNFFFIKLVEYDEAVLHAITIMSHPWACKKETLLIE